MATVTLSGADRGAVPYLMAGPTLGILLSAKAETEDGETLDAKEDIASADSGLGVGAGVRFPSGAGTIFLESFGGITFR